MINNIMSNSWAFVLPLLVIGAVIIFGFLDKAGRSEKGIITPLGTAYGAVCGVICYIMLGSESFYGFLALFVPTEEAGTFEDGLLVLVFVAIIAMIYAILVTVVAGLSKTVSAKVALVASNASNGNIEFDETAGSCGGPDVGQTLRAPDDKTPSKPPIALVKPSNSARQAVSPLCPGGESVKVSVRDMCRIAKRITKEFELTGAKYALVDAPIVTSTEDNT